MVLFLLMMVTTAALMVLLMLMMVTTAALVVLLMLMVVTTAAALVVVLLMLMMVTTTALVMVLLVVMMMTTAAGFPMLVVVMVLPLPAGGLGSIPGVDLHFALHSPGDPDQFGDQGVRVSGGKPQLLGGKGDIRLLHLGVGIELCLDLGGAVGAVQIFDDVYLPGHRNASFDFYI